MAEPCFIKKGSSPHICGVHNVQLEVRQSPNDLTTSRYGDFEYLVCPKSGQVLNDEKKRS
jgi:hypothetical protein